MLWLKDWGVLLSGVGFCQDLEASRRGKKVTLGSDGPLRIVGVGVSYEMMWCDAFKKI